MEEGQPTVVRSTQQPTVGSYPSPTDEPMAEPGATEIPMDASSLGWQLLNQGDFLLYSAGLNNFTESHIYVYWPDDGTSRFVAYGNVLRGQPWSPDGKRFLFENERYGTANPPGQIAIADLASGIITNLNLEGFKGSSFYWSPDGRYLLYRAIEVLHEWRGRVALYDLTTQATTYLTETINVLWLGGWSPDGRKVAYISDEGGHFDLYTIDVTTLEQQQWTDDTTIEYGVGWLPSREAILFGTFDSDHYPELWPYTMQALHVLDIPTRQVTTIGNGDYTSIALDAQGDRIAYQGNTPCVLNLENRQNNCELLGTYQEKTPYFEVPAWSADGTKLAFRAWETRLCKSVYTFNLDTGELAAVAIPGCGSKPVYWSTGAR